MKKILNSHTSRFFLLGIIYIILGLWISLVFVDRMNRMVNYSGVQQIVSESLDLLRKIETHSYRLIRLKTADELASGEFDAALFEESAYKFTSGLKSILDDEIISSEPGLQRRITQSIEGGEELRYLFSEAISLIGEKGGESGGLIYQTRERLEAWSPAANSQLKPFLSWVETEFNSYLRETGPSIPENIYNRWEINKSGLLSGISSGMSLHGVSMPAESAREDLNALFRGIRKLAEIEQKLGFQTNTGIRADISLQINQNSQYLQTILSDYTLLSGESTKRISTTLILTFILFSLILLSGFFAFHKWTEKLRFQLRDSLKKLSGGSIPKPLPVPGEVDFAELFKLIDQHSDNLREKVEFAGQIGEGLVNHDPDRFEDSDELGKALNMLAMSLDRAREEDMQRKKEEEQRQWINEGMNRLGNILRSEREDMSTLSFSILSGLVKYLKASQGFLFIHSGETIDLLAAFAYDRRKFLQKSILPGEGLVGTCAIERETIYLTEIPESYAEISSGLGEAPPRSLLIVPLKLEDELFGIIELASLHLFPEHEIKFVETLGESIAATLAAVRINEKTAELLAQSQKQAAEMALQEEKMRKSMDELQRAQEDSRTRELEIQGILMAINASSLVAEFSPNGRFSDINDQFQLLLESPRDQIVGKHHSEFAIVDKYSDNYKNFWKELKDGQVITRNEHYRLFSGAEVHLRTTFSPVRNEEGRVSKVLSIATDMTQSVQQQKALEKKSSELSRSSLEMKSLSDAIDESLLKCEISPDGIILDLNNNYAESTGYSSREQTGKNIRLFLREPEKEQFEKIMETLNRGKTYNGVIRRTRPTGEELWLMSTFSPVRDDDGIVFKIYFLAQDITEKKLRYQLLEEANREIERLKSRLNETEKL